MTFHDLLAKVSEPESMIVNIEPVCNEPHYPSSNYHTEYVYDYHLPLLIISSYNNAL